MAKKLKSAKKTSSKRVAKKKGAKKKAGRGRPPAGFKRRSSSNLFVPTTHEESVVVNTTKIEQGITEAQFHIRRAVHSMQETLGDDIELTEVQLELSFSADGKFLGIGIGGATSIRITVKPSDLE